MWKITRLYLKNFAAVLAGLQRYEMNLDLSTSENILNIFIGKVGSGKSAILGHLQPFATYGTLDARNQYQDILQKVDGVKIIDFTKETTSFHIVHKYIWNQYTDSHNVKSYFELNGVELNSNGNGGSFKELVKEHFGIDQSYLRLLRLGPNVTNFINMKSTERKSFVASLLRDADLYTILYKKLSERMRVVNATMTSLANKLIHLSAKDALAMSAELEDLEEKRSDQDRILSEIQLEMFRRMGENDSLLNNQSYASKMNTYHELQSAFQNYYDRMKVVQQSLSEATSGKDPMELMKEIGAHEAFLRQGQEDILKDGVEEKRLENLVHKYTDMLKLSKSEDHMDDLRAMVQELEKKNQAFSEVLSGFKCEYTYHFLSGFVDSLSNLKRELEDLAQNDRESISRLLRSDGSIKHWVNQQIDILSAKRYRLAQSLSNLEFSGQYKQVIPMYRPPFCPGKDCPYYATHPTTIQRESGMRGESQGDAMIHRIRDQIRSIDSQVDKYSGYPNLYERLHNAQRRWREAQVILKKLFIVDNDVTFFEILTNLAKRHGWYNHDKLISSLEKCKMKDTYYEVSERLSKTKLELATLENGEEAHLKENLEQAVQQLEVSHHCISECEQDITAVGELLGEKRELYDALVNRATNEAEEGKLHEKMETISIQMEQLGRDLEIIKDNQQIIDQLSAKRVSEDQKLRSIGMQKEHLKAKLNDISYTQKEFEGTEEQKEDLQDILIAVSSKEGIPLIMVDGFLENCRTIINDLITDVFPDSLEILPFIINETEFRIPYIVDGIPDPVPDIEAASQGQSAIISIAFSFALVRESAFDYNIMLLDEVDGPLYKKDREKFTTILFKHLHEIGARQVFLTTHNTLSENNPATIIMTTDEVVDSTPLTTVIKLV